ncbi:hypothetical protein PENSPDRAFT_626581 [Peniophora sp. CONT]|nr:hypothetical protein PENSPDRAFT_626581 [Peniophora sp. CONT]
MPQTEYDEPVERQSTVINSPFSALDLDKATHVLQNTDTLARLGGLRFLIRLSHELFERHVLTDDYHYFQRATSTLRRALELTPDGHPCQPYLLCLLGTFLSAYSGDSSEPKVEDIESAVISLSRGVKLMWPGYPNEAFWLNELGNSLYARYKALGSPDDIQASVTAHRNAVALMPHATFANALGTSLLDLYNLYGDVEDLEESLTAFSNALEFNHDEPSIVLANLGNALHARFKRFKLSEDIETATSVHLRAVQLTQHGSPNFPYTLSCLGTSLHKRYGHTKNLEDQELAMSLHRHAFKLTPHGHPNKAKHYATLGVGLVRRFERTAQLDDIEQAVMLHRRAVEVTPYGHPDRPMHLSNFGNTLLLRFVRTGQLSDLEQAIAVQRCAVELTTDEHPDKSLWCINLGDSLSARFELTGQIEDLEQAVLAHRRAVEITPDGHGCKPRWVNSLGTSLFKRFEYRMGEDDATAASLVYRHALDLTHDGHPEQPSLLVNFGNFLHRRFWTTGDLKDLEMAISCHVRAVDSTPDGHPHKPVMLSGLCNAQRTMFERKGYIGDITAAVSSGQRAIDLCAEGYAHMPGHYNTPALCHLTRFRHTGHADGMGDLEKAVCLLEKAVALTPAGSPAQSTFLENLGRAQDSLFKHTGETQAGFDDVLKSYTDSTLSPFKSPYNRFESARRCVALLATYQNHASTESYLCACSHIISSLSELVWLGHSIQRRYIESSKVREIASTMVYSAISVGGLTLAVEWFEASRGFIWSQLSTLRAPIDELEERHPELAGPLHLVQQQLRLSAHYTFTPDVKTSFGGIDGMSISSEADRHRLHVIEYDNLLKKIRHCTGFEDFMRTKKLRALLPSLRYLNGPVVFINVDQHGCDALILHPDGTVASIELSNLSEERAIELCRLWTAYLRERKVRARGLGSLGDMDGTLNALYPVLECMWTCIVQPVLKSLNFASTKDGRLPHITWCPTGPLTQLPLHAAGVYHDPHGPRAFHFVVSSYTTSLSVLVDDNRNRVERPCSTPAALVVTQPDTPGYSPLPATVYEGTRLQQILASSGIESKILNDGDATLNAVRDAIHSYPWVHFACHGSQDVDDVTQSAFALYDGPLTLRDLMGTASDNAELAFLSACQTAVGDEKIPEESAHLAAGMLAVGFRGVVATMWSIMDADAPIVVEKFYTELLALRSAGVLAEGETGAAYALHEATKVLREKVGESNFMRWVPFVHFGV